MSIANSIAVKKLHKLFEESGKESKNEVDVYNFGEMLLEIICCRIEV